MPCRATVLKHRLSSISYLSPFGQKNRGVAWWTQASRAISYKMCLQVAGAVEKAWVLVLRLIEAQLPRPLNPRDSTL